MSGHEASATKDLERAGLLLALASGEGTPSEEARTAAMGLVRLLGKGTIKLRKNSEGPSINEILSGMGSDEFWQKWERGESVADPPPAQQPIPDPPYASPVYEPEKTPEEIANALNGVSVVTAQAAGFCPTCGDTFAEKERVAFSRLDRKIRHIECTISRRRTTGRV